MALDINQQKPPEGAAKAAAVPKLIKPYFYLSGYYGVLAGVIILMLLMQPGLVQYMPIGGAASFGAMENAFEPVQRQLRPTDSALVEGVKLALSIVSAFLLMLPVTWICMGARRRKDVSQSFIQTILVLPMIITGVVHIVHNSLALAFSLAGIVAGVRFRHTLKDSAETTYLFTAIAVGLACGIHAVEVAAIISIFFNYTVLGLWATEFGAEATSKQSFSREWMGQDDPEADPPRKKKKEEEQEDD